MTVISLRSDLEAAYKARKRLVDGDLSRKPDHDGMRASLLLVGRFLASYPHAEDAKVRHFCAVHSQHIDRILVYRNHQQRARLLGVSK
jgi:hypothetical protein